MTFEIVVAKINADAHGSGATAEPRPSLIPNAMMPGSPLPMEHEE
jgi:hypothetical protein